MGRRRNPVSPRPRRLDEASLLNRSSLGCQRGLRDLQKRQLSVQGFCSLLLCYLQGFLFTCSSALRCWSLALGYGCSGRMLWGRVLAALDSPVVRGVGRVVLCSQVQNPLGPQGHMRMPFERSDEASCFLQADLIAKQLSLEQYRHTGEESWGRSATSSMNGTCRTGREAWSA